MFPPSLTLKRNASGDVTVTVTGEDGCAVEGDTVAATINLAGQKRVSVSPTSAVTDENGQSVFIVTGIKTGKAEIIFSAQEQEIKKTLTVKVKGKGKK